MAKGRSRKRKNPSTAQWFVLGIGGTVGLGLLGWGIYLAVKPATPALPGGTGFGGGTPAVYSWSVSGSGNRFTPIVITPTGRRILLPAVPNYGAAQAAALRYIESQGGVARSA